jgi:hypothetical protein
MVPGHTHPDATDDNDRCVAMPGVIRKLAHVCAKQSPHILNNSDETCSDYPAAG